MAKAAFCYIAGQEQETALIHLVADCWTWLTAAARPHISLRAILESPQAVTFDWLASADAIKGWPQGRAFGLQGEISWRCEDGLTHVVLITDGETLPEIFNSNTGQGAVGVINLREIQTQVDDAEANIGDANRVRLWGERLDEQRWRETRIPDLLHYPVVGKGSYVSLRLRRYIQTDRPDDGSVDFVRYVDLTIE